MKIYNRFTMSMATGAILEENSFEYEGPVALACGGSPDPPAPPPPPPPPPKMKETAPAVKEARDSQVSKAQKAAGLNSTLMTGGLGLSDQAQTDKKKLLGA